MSSSFNTTSSQLQHDFDTASTQLWHSSYCNMTATRQQQDCNTTSTRLWHTFNKTLTQLRQLSTRLQHSFYKASPWLCHSFNFDTASTLLWDTASTQPWDTLRHNFSQLWHTSALLNTATIWLQQVSIYFFNKTSLTRLFRQVFFNKTLSTRQSLSTRL